MVVPHPLGGIPTSEVQAKADAAFNDIVKMINRVPEQEKGDTSAVPAYPARTVKVAGSSIDPFRVFYEEGWTDGLPIIPPTRERVEYMLKGTKHKPDEIIGQLAPREGIATVERVAINAVMAGCMPEYLPVVLAAVEAIADPENYMATWATTTGSNSPLFIVNGPIREELKINYGTNAFGKGRRANATIGRTINLITGNIGGAISGISDMTTLGGAWEYTNCVAENEAALPSGWQPLNVELGFPADTSTLTVKIITSQLSIWGHRAQEFKQIMDTLAAEIVGANGVGAIRGGGVLLALGPEHADLAGKDGWSKEDIRQYLFEKARQPLKNWKYLGDNLQAREFMPEVKTESDDYMTRMILKPDDIMIIVAGGPGKHSMWWPGSNGTLTKSIDKWR